MAYKDVLLGLVPYPEPTPVSVVNQAVDIAAAIGGKISALACGIKILASGSILARALFHAAAKAAAETGNANENAETILAAFQKAAEQRGTFQERIFEHCLPSEVPEILIKYARLHDLTIVPIPPDGILDDWYADSIIFGSGRPTVVIPQVRRQTDHFELGTVVVAWDFSRPAARAVADALPILERAKRVFVVTVTNEKLVDGRCSGPELGKHLARHGIDIIPENIDAAGRRIGDVLEAYAEMRKADLLVMGAYGHSRIRDLVLGGATMHMVSRAPLPVFMSH